MYCATLYRRRLEEWEDEPLPVLCFFFSCRAVWLLADILVSTLTLAQWPSSRVSQHQWSIPVTMSVRVPLLLGVYRRYEAIQEIATQALLGAISQGSWDGHFKGTVVECLKRTMQDPNLDGSFKALCIALPSVSYLSDLVEPGTADVFKIRDIRKALASKLQMIPLLPFLNMAPTFVI